jgi:hypothetical protein
MKRPRVSIAGASSPLPMTDREQQEMTMNRTACLAAVALTLVLGATFAQSRSGIAGGSDLDDQPGAGGFRAVGAFGGEVRAGVRRSVQLEMEGGQNLVGTIVLWPLVVDSDLGEYSIHPDKIKMIRFLKRVDEDNVEGEVAQRDFRGVVAKKKAMPQRDRHGNLLVPDQTSPTGAAWLTHGKVITTSNKEIIGDIHIPTDFQLELEFGHLTPAPDKLRILTLIDDEQGVDASKAKAGARPDVDAPKGDSAQPDAPAAGKPAGAGRPGRSDGLKRSERPEVRKP